MRKIRMIRVMRTRANRLFLPSVAVVLLGLLLASCAVNPATGKRQLMLISEADEVAMGREAHEQILQTMGVYDDQGVQEYVAELGAQLAAVSERPNLPWTFTVLDDAAVNAFALPGGFIYVTRGIMTHLDSEAELVGVLGHEIGHVTGRHGASRMSKAQLMSVGLGVGMIVSPELQQFGDLAMQGMQLLFLKYSRDDERQADDLGLRYTVAGGWDAREMPEVFGVLKSVGEASGAGRLPGWLSTHPDPGQRQERIGAQLASLEQDFTGSKLNREPYLGQLDGMIFGPNPREGFFEESEFLHPELAFRLTFPEGWRYQNQRQQVAAMSPNQDAIVALTLDPEADPQAAARKFLSQEGLRSGRIQRGSIHGIPAAGADFEVPREQQEAIRGQVAFLRYDNRTYRLLGYTLESKWNGYGRPIGTFIESFQQLRDRRVLEIQPARVDLVKPRRDIPLQSFQSQFPSSIPVETLALINHVSLDGFLAGGASAKRVVGGPGS